MTNRTRSLNPFGQNGIVRPKAKQEGGGLEGYGMEIHPLSDMKGAMRDSQFKASIDIKTFLKKVEIDETYDLKKMGSLPFGAAGSSAVGNDLQRKFKNRVHVITDPSFSINSKGGRRLKRVSNENEKADADLRAPKEGVKTNSASALASSDPLASVRPTTSTEESAASDTSKEAAPQQATALSNESASAANNAPPHKPEPEMDFPARVVHLKIENDNLRSALDKLESAP